MSLLQNSNAISTGGYDINNSLRFRQSAVSRLTRTPSTTTNQRTWTWSAWIKRGLLNVENKIFGAGTSGSNVWYLMFGDGGSGDKLAFGYWNGSTHPTWLITTQVFRDPSACYHIVLAVDTTQATSSNRIKLYVNGNQVTSFDTATYPSQNTDTLINNSSTTQYIGNATTPVDTCYDGYMAEINFIDGLQKAASDFGETDTTTGVWKPKAYTGTYGTNGYYLKFSDIATTSGSNAGLGKDFSGNSNYWTTNNISVTAGSTYDAMKDSPTNTSATVANYAVLNPLRSYSSVTIASGNLNYSASFDGSSVATIGMDSGKYYWEATLTNANAAMIGLNKMTETLFGFVGYSAASYGYFGTNGNKFNNNVSTSYGNSYTNGDVIGVAFDATNGKLFFSKNGTWQNSGDPAAGTNAAFTGLTGDTYVPAVGHGTMAAAMNFGQRPFSYTPPTGFVALNTYNLPTPTILQGNKYMDANLWSGNSSAQTIVNQAQFKPDFVWVKSRTNTQWNNLTDSVRGVTKLLYSNATNAEATNSTALTAFNSNGFSVGDDSGGNGVNTSGQNYVGWQWQAGQGSTSSNTSGSITSTVSVNTTAGFSVLTYTGTGANATVGHGLGVAPKMIILKPRSAVDNWMSYHSELGNTKYILLNSTNAAAVGSGAWNNTSPTSSVFTIGTSGNVNTNGVTMVGYCWADVSGFSKAFSYTGNGSTDGPFVFTNFTPKFILIKQSSAAGENWVIYDTVRNTYNVANLLLHPNLSNAESTTTLNPIDVLSNGFKMRGSSGLTNTNGATYIGMAWASNPFKNSNAF